MDSVDMDREVERYGLQTGTASSVRETLPRQKQALESKALWAWPGSAGWRMRVKGVGEMQTGSQPPGRWEGPGQTFMNWTMRSRL